MYRSIHRFPPLLNSPRGQQFGAAACAVPRRSPAWPATWSSAASRCLHTTACTSARRSVDGGPKVNEEALFLHARPQPDNSFQNNAMKSARELIKEIQSSERSAKVLSNIHKVQKRKAKRDKEYAKLTGKAPPPTRPHTGAPDTGRRAARENAKHRNGPRGHPITDEPEANLPPPGRKVDAETREKYRVGMRGSEHKIMRQPMIPIVFGSRTRPVGRSYARMVDRLRTKAGKMRTKHPMQVMNGGMSSGCDLVSYCRRMEKLTARNQRLADLLQHKNDLEAGVKPMAKAKGEKTDGKASKALAIPERPTNSKDAALRRNVELLAIANTISKRPHLQYAPTDDNAAEKFLKTQKRLDDVTYGQRFMPSDREGSEREVLVGETKRRALANARGKNRQTRFHDCVSISVKGGRGGDGRQKSRSVGGDGGNVYIEAVRGVSLDAVANLPVRKFTSEAGGSGELTKLKGRRGNDLVISVPVGTVIGKLNSIGKKTFDLNHDGQKLLAVKGGAGGSVFTDPAWKGQRGQAQQLRLELKMLADVGLVGFPNAGKSTLLSRMSRSEPKIASYPFTTIRPQIGIVNYLAGERVSMADLPGLIEGAHMNVGLGHRFLRHLERCKVLLYMVDINGFQLSLHDETRHPIENIEILAEELELYKEGLSQRPAILCITKMDTPGAVDKCRALLEDLKEYMVDGATIPDLDKYKQFAEEDFPEERGDQRTLKFLPEQDHILQDPLQTAEGPLVEKKMSEIDAGKVLEELGHGTEAISDTDDIHVSDFPVPDTSGNAQTANPGSSLTVGNPFLKDDVADRAQQILDTPTPTESLSRDAMLQRRNMPLSTANIKVAANVLERSRRQRSQLRGLAMGFDYEHMPLNDEPAIAEADDEELLELSDSSGGRKSKRTTSSAPVPSLEEDGGDATAGEPDEDERSLLALSESSVAVAGKAGQESRVARRGLGRKLNIKFQQVIPISCRQELQGLDFLFMTMRGVVKASRRLDGERVNFTEQLVHSEPQAPDLEELEEAQRLTRLKEQRKMM